MAAPNGAHRTKSDHPNLPITISEIVREAKACFEAGAAALHLHIRSATGGHTIDPGIYREALAELGSTVPDMPVQITTEAAGIYSTQEQLRVLQELNPSWASVAIREIARKPEIAAQVYASCANVGTKVQHIIYDQTDLDLLIHWTNVGILKYEAVEVIFVIGQYNPSIVGTLSALDSICRNRPDWISSWMVCAFGPKEHLILLAAAAQGADLRVGFENNISRPNGQRANSTAEAVARLRSDLRRTQPDKTS
ncbi:MAG: 3-keto-5-aminohexanoate cleavage protein [Pseudomonadota bacterium]